MHIDTSNNLLNAC